MVTFFDAHTHRLPGEGCSGIVNVKWNHREDSPLPELCSAGIHPAEAETAELPLLEKLLRTGRISFLGECGLDHCSNVPAEIQKRVFRHQIGLSEELHLPMIIHSVRSHPEIIAERKKAGAHLPWIIHSFRGNKTEAEMFRKHDCILSLAPAYVLHAERIPFPVFLLETDTGDCGIEELYRTAAEKCGCSTEELSEMIRRLLSEKFLLKT